MQIQESGCLGLNASYYLVIVGPWASLLIFLGLNFPIYKMGDINRTYLIRLKQVIYENPSGQSLADGERCINVSSPC